MCSTKIENFSSSSLWTCLHHMVILRSRNKITDFLMILAWASPFNFYVSIMSALSRLYANVGRSNTLDQSVFIIFIFHFYLSPMAMSGTKASGGPPVTRRQQSESGICH